MEPKPEPPDVAMLAAALRADTSDLNVYANVLTATLADALPDGMVEVDRARSLGDRLAGRPGTATSVRLRFGDVTLELTPARAGQLRARELTEVRGVVISRRDLTVDDWANRLAEQLTTVARRSQAANLALSRLLGL
jgi:hypothetical protein